MGAYIKVGFYQFLPDTFRSYAKPVFLEALEDFKADYLDGKTRQFIMDKYGITYRTYFRLIRASGIIGQCKKPRMDLFSFEDLVKDYQDGLHQDYLAKKYQVSQKSIVKFLKLNGVKLRQRGGRQKSHHEQQQRNKATAED
jgi:hypothetical protein